MKSGMLQQYQLTRIIKAAIASKITGMKENFPLINERERENLRSSIETLNGEQMEILEQKMSYLK